MNKECEHCKMDIEIRNPSGFCDHLYYPENCKVCSRSHLPDSKGWGDWESDLLELADLSFGSRFVGEHCSKFSDYETRMIKFIKDLLSQEQDRIKDLEDEILGMIVKNSKGVDALDDKHIFHLHMERFEKDLKKFLSDAINKIKK